MGLPATLVVAGTPSPLYPRNLLGARPAPTKTKEFMAVIPNLINITSNIVPKFLLTPEASIQELLETASLYLHIPFCHTRCHYCDFNTYAGILPLREPYVRALLTEIALAGEQVRYADGTPRRSRTIFFGGGTPSLLTVSQIQRLLKACFEAFT